MKTINLQLLLNKREIVDAFNALKKRRFRRDFSELRRFSSEEEKELNSLGVFLKKTDITSYYTQLKTFSFTPYQGVRIEKSKNNYRPLLVPTPADRVALLSVFPKIKNRLDNTLKQHEALGMGMNKSKKDDEFKRVLTEIENLLGSDAYKYALKLDYKNFFSSIDRKSLLKRLRPYFKDTEGKLLFQFIKSSLTNSIEANTEFWESFRKLNLKKVGIPQGLSYSPLLASFFAIPLDEISSKTPNIKG